MFARKSLNTLRVLSLISTLVTLSVVITTPASTVSDKTCREHPNLVGKCFTVRGRLAVYNGAPALRIWKIGTKRILGVSEQRFAVPGYQNVPEDIRNQIDQDNVILADFLVCPFTKLKQKEMQMVCIEKANNMVVKARSN